MAAQSFTVLSNNIKDSMALVDVSSGQTERYFETESKFPVRIDRM